MIDPLSAVVGAALLVGGPTLVARNAQGKNGVFNKVPDLNKYAHFGIPGEDDNNEYLLRAFSRNSLAHLNKLSASGSSHTTPSMYVETVEPVETEQPVQTPSTPVYKTNPATPINTVYKSNTATPVYKPGYVNPLLGNPNDPVTQAVFGNPLTNKNNSSSSKGNSLDWLNQLLPLLAIGGLGYLAGRR